MTRRRLVAIAIATMLVVAIVAGQWWLNGHTVDLVVVNASGRPVEIAWEPAPGAPMSSEVDAGCSSSSLPLSRGSAWRVSVDGDVVIDSAAAALPIFEPLVAVEVWLAKDGSIRIVPAHAISKLVDAPYPDCTPSARE